MQTIESSIKIYSTNAVLHEDDARRCPWIFSDLPTSCIINLAYVTRREPNQLPRSTAKFSIPASIANHARGKESTIPCDKFRLWTHTSWYTWFCKGLARSARYARAIYGTFGCL